MRHSTKSKVAVARLPVRKTVVVPSVLSRPPRRGFAAWIPAAEGTGAFPAATVTARVRDGLVLRAVGVKEKAKVKNLSRGSGAR